MAGNENENSTSTWPADVKDAEGPGQIDPNVLPEYTLLPGSPTRSVVSYNDSDLAAGAGNTHPSPSSPSPSPSPSPNAAMPTSGPGTEPASILKLLYTGVLALVVPPVFCFWAGLAAGAAILYGCGKILEAIGRALAFVPEAVYRGWVAQRADGLLRATVTRAGGVSPHCPWEGEREEVQVVPTVEGHGQVALEDVEAGQAGPISI